MTVNCPACGYDQNPADSEYCEACGSEMPKSGTTQNLGSVAPLPLPLPDPISTTTSTSLPAITQPTPPSVAATITTIPVASSVASTARLIAKAPNSPVSEFPLDGSSAIVGKFDQGPVEVDLENFAGSETVSRTHAEIYQEAGQWKVKDLDSINGTFLKRLGQSRFGIGITTSEILNSGDEIAFGKVRFLFQSP